MLVDPENIQIVQWDAVNWSESICSLKTADVVFPYTRDFHSYTRDFHSKSITGGYLEALILAWLDDLAFHWKLKTPPASKELAAIGLLQRLENGSTKRDVEIGGDTVLRDEFSDEYWYRT